MKETIRYVNRVEKLVKDAGEDGLYRKAVYNRIRVDKKAMDLIFDTLADAGKVFQDWQNEKNPGAYVHTDTQRGKDAHAKAKERARTAEEVKQAHRKVHQN